MSSEKEDCLLKIQTQSLGGNNNNGNQKKISRTIYTPFDMDALEVMTHNVLFTAKDIPYPISKFKFFDEDRITKGKRSDWMFVIMTNLTPSMNYIPFKRKLSNSGDKVSTLDDVEDLDDQQDLLLRGKEGEYLCAKEKELVNITFPSSTLIHLSKFCNTPTDSDDDIAKDVLLHKPLMLRMRNGCQSAFYMATSQKKCIQTPPGFEDPAHPNKVYNFVNTYASSKSPRA
ncbi:hypothetical protein Tco_0565289 [Tanacetum coccineum]